jgi:hypothetical protein
MVYKMKLAEISEIELDDDPFRPHPAFTKLHGNGNDFILIERPRSWPEVQRRLTYAAAAHLGIGGGARSSGAAAAQIGNEAISADG